MESEVHPERPEGDSERIEINSDSGNEVTEIREAISQQSPGISDVSKRVSTNIDDLPDEEESISVNFLPRSRFATLELISPFIPKADSDHPRAQKWLSQRGVVLNMALITAAVVFLINLIGTVVLMNLFGSAEIFRGNCQTASHLSRAFHVGINLLSSLLLSSSNLSMQLLVAPTRNEVDRAHENFIWLDIGVPSLRNLRHIAKRRRLAWCILGLSSLPLHFLYNSAIFSTTPTNTVKYLVVTPEFLTGGHVDADEVTRTVESRRNLSIEIRQPLPPYGIVQEKLDSAFFDNSNDFNISRSCGEEGCKDYQRKALNGTFNKNLTALECLSVHTTWFGNRSDVLLISTQDLLKSQTSLPPTNESLLFMDFSPGFEGPGMYWPCITSTFDCRKPSSWNKDPKIIENWNIIGYKIDYCLGSELDSENLCSVKYSLTIMAIVCCTNSLKCICILYTAHLYRGKADEPIATVGDAITSFLASPDDTTLSMCLANKYCMPKDKENNAFIRNLTRKLSCSRASKTTMSNNSSNLWGKPIRLTWSPDKHRWSEAASQRRWFGTLIPCILLIATGGGFLALGLVTLQNNAGRAGSFVQLGFGSPSEYAQGRLGLNGHIGSLRAYGVYLYTDTIVANIWQFIVSILYVQYNSLLSCMLANREWHLYAFRKKSLRVSFPVGLQRGSYYLSMPFKYGIPLLSTMTVLHWTLSQSVFIMPIEPIYSDGTVDIVDHFSTVGFSIWPIITSIIIGIILVVTVVSCGFKRYPSGMPLGATCSAVISAACHPPPEDRDAYRFPVQWGAVLHASSVPLAINALGLDNSPRQDEGVRIANSPTRTEVFSRSLDVQSQITPGHCCFTTARDVEEPKLGELYS